MRTSAGGNTGVRAGHQGERITGSPSSVRIADGVPYHHFSFCMRRLPASSTPVLLMQQDWALGLVSLKFLHHTMAGVADRRLLRRPYFTTFRTYVWPHLQQIAVLLAIPYLVSRGILPYCGLPVHVLQVGFLTL